MAQGMNKLNEALVSLPEVRELLLSLDAGTSPIAVSGLSGVHRAQFTAAVRHKTQRPLLIVCADENEANRMAGDLHELLGEDVSLLFAREWQLRDRVFASHGWEQQRIGSLCSLAAGKAPILVATVDGLMQRTLPPDALRGAVTDISLGDRFDLNALSKKLVESGYTRAETVEGVGQFALRGGILDVWSPLSAPVRVEFFGDEIDRISEFNPVSGQVARTLQHIAIYPASHYVTTKDKLERAIVEIDKELDEREAQFLAEGKAVEAQRIRQRTRYDIEMLRELFAGKKYNGQEGRKPLEIFKQDLPIPEENDVDADTDVAHAPYIVVRMTGGEIADDKSPQTVEFSLIICAYDTGIERAGFQDVANIKEDIVQRACTAPYFGGAFTILKPIAWALQQDDTAPYYYGAVTMNCTAPAMTQDTELEGLL